MSPSVTTCDALKIKFMKKTRNGYTFKNVQGFLTQTLISKQHLYSKDASKNSDRKSNTNLLNVLSAAVDMFLWRVSQCLSFLHPPPPNSLSLSLSLYIISPLSLSQTDPFILTHSWQCYVSLPLPQEKESRG